MTFDEWLDLEYPEGGSGPGLVYTRDDMQEAFGAGFDAATNYYAEGGSFK